jgi:sugar/nucleoside kinase (ribokinase family)
MNGVNGDPTLVTRFLVVGDIVTDILAVHTEALAVDSDTSARISISGGGSAANTAAWLASIGAVVDLLGVVGTDVAGDDRLAELIAAGVGCGQIRRTAAAPTGSVIVLARAQGRTMLCDRGANHELRPSDVDDALAALPDLAHVHLSGYALLDQSSRPAGQRALAAAAERGLSTSVDAASAAPLGRVGGHAFLSWVRDVDLLFANLDEAQVLVGSTMHSAATLAATLAQTVRSAVVKLGPDGAVWASADGVIPVPAETATVVDTTGAGDAFAAGLLAARNAGLELEVALAAAVRLGAQAVQIVGGRPVSPRR